MKERFLGEIIKQRRQELGITQAELCEGICEPPTLSRIENKKQTPTRNVLNALLQRLGISDDRFYAALTAEEITIKQLSSEINRNIIRYERALPEEEDDIRGKILSLLKDFEEIVEEDDTYSKQFIIGSDVIIGGPHGDYTAQQKLDKLVEAIKLTHPSFDMNELEEGLYSYDEVKLINQIANIYSETDERQKSIAIRKALLDNIDRRFDDLPSPLLYKSMITYGYARDLLIINEYEKTRQIAEEGRRIAAAAGFSQLLPGFIMMIAECDYNLGNMENSKELFIETYYLSKAVLDNADAQIAAATLKEYFCYEM